VAPCNDKSVLVTKLPDPSVNNILFSVVPVGTDVTLKLPVTVAKVPD
jgi:hypothetical protein